MIKASLNISVNQFSWQSKQDQSGCGYASLQVTSAAPENRPRIKVCSWVAKVLPSESTPMHLTP